jgi:hypothetical protein
MNCLWNADKILLLGWAGIDIVKRFILTMRETDFCYE